MKESQAFSYHPQNIMLIKKPRFLSLPAELKMHIFDSSLCSCKFDMEHKNHARAWKQVNTFTTSLLASSMTQHRPEAEGVEIHFQRTTQH